MHILIIVVTVVPWQHPSSQQRPWQSIALVTCGKPTILHLVAPSKLYVIYHLAYTIPWVKKTQLMCNKAYHLKVGLKVHLTKKNLGHIVVSLGRCTNPMAQTCIFYLSVQQKSMSYL